VSPGVLTAREEAKVLRACTEIVAERGYKAMSMDEVAALAGVDRKRLGRHFTSKEECFLAAWDAADEEYVGRAVRAFSAEAGWRAGMRAVAFAIVDYLQTFPAESRLMLEARNAGKPARMRLQASMDVFVELLDQGRQELPDPDSLSPATAEGIGGAVFEQVTMLMRHGADDGLRRLLPQMLFMVFQPYLGIEAAMEEMRIAAVDPAKG
jgi:AcrR family transcriptional regulator